MEDGPPGDLTTSERLDLLRRYEASWKNLEWNEHNTIPSHSRGRFGIWESYGNVLACKSEGETIDFKTILSLLREQWLRSSY